MTNTAIPAGYKQTEVGIIPEDWDVNPLGDVASFGGGTTPSRSQQEKYFANGVFLWVKTTDLNNSYICETEEKITQSAMNETCLALHPSKTILVAMYGGFNQIGRTGLLLSPATINQALSAVIPNDKFIVSHYALHYLNFNVDYWKNVASSSRKDPNITSNDIKSFPIIFPSTKEQTAIATVLSDVDTLITSLNAQIAKKRDIKTAAMQQLLTGKQRLAGFEGDWEWKKFNDVVYGFSSGSTPYRQVSNFYKGNIKWVTSGELNYNIVFDTIEKISSDALKSASLTIHPAETFLMAITGLEAQGTRGSCAILGVPATTNQSCMALYPKENFSIYYLYYYYCYFGDDFAFEYCQGTKQQSYTAKIVKILPIKVPPTKEEQEAIAGVLSAMDEDIAALEQRLAKTKALKQGMMQELLTGRTRLVVGSTKPSPFDLYEQTKRENFVHSSRLEGIDIPSKQTPASLADVLKKYSVD